MKYFSFFIFTFLYISSCSGTQKAIQSQPATNEDIVVITRVPDAIISSSTPETPQAPEPPKAEIKVETEVEETPITPIPDDIAIVEAFDHQNWNKLVSKYVSKGGNVDYLAFKKNRKYLLEYIDELSNNLPKDAWSKEDKLAYWINAYNALTIDLILHNYPTKSIKDIKDPWDQRLWNLGDKWYNLNDIEHKILRKMNEPRIHFAIVCASVSCPKLQNEAFTVSNLEEQLTNATKEFLADTSKNELSENNIKLSKIFKWFKKDFEKNGSLIDFINQYAETTISPSAKKSYTDYNWNLND